MIWKRIRNSLVCITTNIDVPVDGVTFSSSLFVIVVCFSLDFFDAVIVEQFGSMLSTYDHSSSSLVSLLLFLSCRNDKETLDFFLPREGRNDKVTVSLFLIFSSCLSRMRDRDKRLFFTCLCFSVKDGRMARGRDFRLHVSSSFHVSFVLLLHREETSSPRHFPSFLER